jgi:hypothetical protein
MKTAKVGFGVVLAVFMLVAAGLYSRFPVYNERKVTNIIERNIPAGTSQTQVIKFLNTLKSNDVVYEKGGGRVAAYFPDTIISMRGWSYVAVYFTFKNGKMSDYKMKRVSI